MMRQPIWTQTTVAAATELRLLPMDRKRDVAIPVKKFVRPTHRFRGPSAVERMSNNASENITERS
jgi:hypothetical protein